MVIVGQPSRYVLGVFVPFKVLNKFVRRPKRAAAAEPRRVEPVPTFLSCSGSFQRQP